ncbi:MAG: delta-60 repeat domain-containing protein, partial [Fulvivirga sp.]
MKNILLILLVLITYHSNSQHLVDSFNMPTPKTFASIDEIKVTPDHKILLAGDIDFHNGTEVQSVIKLNLDGSLDSNFEFTHEKSIKKIEFLSTGEIIALDRDSLYKINEFGTIISSLNLGVSTFYSDFEIKNDYIFLAANGLGLKKYDSNFTLVTGFNNDNLFENGVVRTLAFQNEKILVAGTFSSVNGVFKNDIARFDSNGNLDETFDTGLGTSDPLTAMVVQDDNKIILSESYINSFNEIPCNGLARLNEDGSVDLEFSPPIINSHVGSNVIVHNDQILLTESYFIGEDNYFRLVKLNLDGTLNSSFELNDYSSKIALLPGGDILINTDALKKYSNEGTIDSDFDPLLERIGYINNAAFHDNFIIVTGDFYSLDGIVTNQIGKIDFNGNVDSNFIFTNEVTHETFPRQVKVIEEDEIFISFGDKLLKLDNFGNPAPDFNTPEEVIKPSGKTDSYFAEKFEFLSNDKIVIAGPNGLYILNEDGSQDTSFDFENTSDISYSNFTLGLQSTGKIIYESELSEVNNIEVNKMVRV